MPEMRLLLALFFLPSLALGELVFVAAVWRHGDRAPAKLPYPKDKNDETAWPRGWNQLTNEGMLQTYNLGTWLRNRYVNDAKHIKGTFDYKQVYVRSSDSERALASAQSVMAGLYPAEADSVWKKGFPWQPTPIHSYGSDREDPLLKPTSVDCPNYKKVLSESNDDTLGLLDKQYADFFVNLTKLTGMEKVDASNVEHLYNIAREKLHNLPQPEWVTDEVMAKITDLKRITRLDQFNSVAKSKFTGGYLLGDWLRRLNAAAAGTDKINTVLYSSHDGTLSSLMYVATIGNDQLIPYSAVVIAELHKEDSKHIVKLFFKNDTALAQPGDSAFQMTIDGCDADCPLDKFNALLGPNSVNTTEQLEEMCKNNSIHRAFFLAILTVVLAALLGR